MSPPLATWNTKRPSDSPVETCSVTAVAGTGLVAVTSGVTVGVGVSVGCTGSVVGVLVGDSFAAVGSGVIVAVGWGVIVGVAVSSKTTDEAVAAAVSAASGTVACPQPDNSSKRKDSSKILFIITYILYTPAHRDVPYRDYQLTPNSRPVVVYTTSRRSGQSSITIRPPSSPEAR
jgi:hypothetical protein